MIKPLLVDLYCCSGGATRGYQQAGFRVIGVDIESKYRRNYPAPFIVDDALVVLRTLLNGGSVGGYQLDDIAAFHASPPCQGWSQLSVARGDGTQYKYPNLIPSTRELLIATWKPYAIENIVKAPMVNTAITLCGTQFGKRYMWHRKFDCNFYVTQLKCDHNPATTYASPFTMPNYNRIKHDFGPTPNAETRFHLWRGVDWTHNNKERREAIPPIYAEYVGQYLMRQLVSQSEMRLAA